MHIYLPARRLTSALSLALSLLALAAALLAPAQTAAQTRTLARTHRPACSTSTSHSKTKRTVHPCVSSSHKGKGDAHHARKGHGKHGPAKKEPHTKTSGSPALAPASCEDGGASVRAADGSFTCRDGSAPGCEDGSTPAPSKSGAGLLCATALSEDGSDAGEAECEEDLDSTCGPGTELGSGEHACQASPGDGSNFVCEDER